MSATSQELKAVDKQLQALKLRQAGISYEEIARRVGYRSASGAYQAVKSAMKKTLREPADEIRQIELSRLDTALFAIWSDVKRGNLFAIDRFLKLSERRSRLLGLDAKREVSIDGNILVGDIEKIREKRWENIQNQLSEMDSQDKES
jgi:hypothetical protein